MTTAAATAVAWLVAGAQLPATAPGNVPEPAGVYTGPMHGYTPPTLRGATVVDAEQLAAVIKVGHPVLLDVAEPDHKPAGLAPTAPWSPRHHSIPGSVWLPGAGRGTLPSTAQTAFDKRVATLARGDKATPIVTYCHPDCWGSWNAAKRLVLAGYSRVYWLPQGVEGWQERYPTEVVKPDAEWSARTSDTGQ